MNARKLIVLGIIFTGIVLVLLVLRVSRPERPGLIEEAGFVQLAPPGFLAADVSWFELWRTGKDAEKIVIRKSGDLWVVGSRFNAPADAEKVGKFLDLYKGLMGSFRSDQASLIDDYGLGKDALHLKIVRAGDTQEPVELLIGKKSKFARQAEANAVYSIDADFNRELGLWGEEPTAPGAAEWLKKKILTLAKDDLTRVELVYPDKTILLERKEKPPAPVAEVPAGETPKAAPKSEFEWLVTSPLPAGMTAKANAAAHVLDRLADLECSDVADPAKVIEWGLDKPPFVLKAFKAQGDPVEIRAGLPDPDKDAYLQLSTAAGTVFMARSWSFTGLFPKARDLFDGVPEPGIKKEEIQEVTVTNLAGASFTLRGPADNPGVVAPVLALPPDTDRVKGVFEGLAGLRFEDMSDPAAAGEFGFVPGRGQVVITRTDGSRRMLEFGGPCRLMKGNYLRVEGVNGVGSVAVFNVDRILAPVDALFKKELVSIGADSIQSVEVRRGNELLALSRVPDGWQIVEGGAAYPADPAAVMTYLAYFAPVTVTGPAIQEGTAVIAIVTVGHNDGGSDSFKLARTEDGLFTIAATGRPGVYQIDEMVVNRLAAVFEKFRGEALDTAPLPSETAPAQP
ncbi:MAG: DUF4340 domain-containing protein [Planctomycetota bacterium]